MTLQKSKHEEFTRFFEAPTRESLRELLKRHMGETDSLDFKREWPEKEKLSKHILAFSNSGGGALVVGVEENEQNLQSVGVKQLKDKSDIHKQTESYIPGAIEYSILDFEYSASEYEEIVGKSFQVLIVESKESIVPVLSKRSGQEIRNNTVYVRRGTNTTEASYEDLQSIINTRIETEYSTSGELELREHMDQLKVLYSFSSKVKYSGFSVGLGKAASRALLGDPVVNPYHPEESFDKFVSLAIEKKKRAIMRLIG